MKKFVTVVIALVLAMTTNMKNIKGYGNTTLTDFTSRV